MKQLNRALTLAAFVATLAIGATFISGIIQSESANAAKGGADRPLSGWYDGRFAPPGVLGSGNISHLGKVRVEGVFPFLPRLAFELLPWPEECLVVLTIDPLPPGSPVPISKWIAANGDELHHTNLTGPANWTQCVRTDGTGVAHANFVIIGGTGRFENASGDYAVEFLLPESLPGTPPESLEATIVLGSISY